MPRGLCEFDGSKSPRRDLRVRSNEARAVEIKLRRSPGRGRVITIASRRTRPSSSVSPGRINRTGKKTTAEFHSQQVEFVCGNSMGGGGKPPIHSVERKTKNEKSTKNAFWKRTPPGTHTIDDRLSRILSAVRCSDPKIPKSPCLSGWTTLAFERSEREKRNSVSITRRRHGRQYASSINGIFKRISRRSVGVRRLPAESSAGLAGSGTQNNFSVFRCVDSQFGNRRLKRVWNTQKKKIFYSCGIWRGAQDERPRSLALQRCLPRNVIDRPVNYTRPAIRVYPVVVRAPRTKPLL